MNLKKTLAAAMLGAAVLWSLPCALYAQSAANQQTTEVDSLLVTKTPEQKRLINKFEFFIGPSLSFNYGDKYLGNYSYENTSFRRMAKPGHTLGFGVYHSFKNRLALNARLQYEQKGKRSERIVTEPHSVIRYSDYAYNYFTLAISPTFYLGSKRRFFISGGGYVSRMVGMKHFNRGKWDGEVIHEGYVDGRIWYSESSTIFDPGRYSFYPYDLGTVMSIGYSIPFKNDLLTIQLIDNLGLTNINRYTPFGQREKNHTIQLLVGYSFLR